MREIHYFTKHLCLCASEEIYKQQKEELDLQILELLALISGASQPCHCETMEQHDEHQDYDLQVEEEIENLKKSIRIALYM